MGTSSAQVKKGPVYLFGRYRLNSDGILYRQNREIHLAPKELEALRFLILNAGRVVTAFELKQHLWDQVNVTSESLPRCISSLRAALEPDEVIQTVYKRGYRFVASVQCQDQGPVALPQRIVVLPFATGEDVTAYLGPAIAEEMIMRLSSASVAGRKVVSVLARDSVFALAQQGQTAQQVGKAMAADLALTGNLRALPEHFRLRVEAIRVEDSAEIWVDDFLVERSPIAGFETEMIRRILARINMESFSLAVSTEPLPASSNEVSRLEAYEAFRRGHYRTSEPLRREMHEGLLDLLRATELDPTLITAQIDLINALITRTYCGLMSPAMAAEQARRAARALPAQFAGSANVLPPIGWIRFHLDHNLEGALRAFQQGADLPYDPWVSRARVTFALSRHRFDEAIALIEDALRIDPYAPWQHGRLIWAWHLAGNLDKSLLQAEHALKLFPGHEGVTFYASIVTAFAGQTERALQMTEALTRRFPHFDLALALHGYALACAGREQEAAEIVERLQWLSRERYVSSSFLSAICVKLGNLDCAIEELRAAEEARCPWFFQMLADPRLQALHGMPEFQRMLGALTTMESSISKGTLSATQEHALK